jgi:ABC-type molybdate transport system substrate-binding protein
MRKLVGLLLLLAGVAVIYISLSSSMDEANKQVNAQVQTSSARSLQEIEEQVAQDAVKQYEIVHRSGSAIDRCVHAGIVAAGFVQAKDEANYQVWKGIQRRECKRAGMPASAY